MVAPKVSIQRTHTGSFVGDESQRQARLATVKTNAHVDAIAVLNNRAYQALLTDTGNIAVAAYATLLTATITTLLARGFLIITFTASGVETTTLGSASFQVVLDGVVVDGAYTTVAAGAAFTASMVKMVPVARGKHTVLLQWKTSVANARINALTVVEEHASLLVQEVS